MSRGKVNTKRGRSRFSTNPSGGTNPETKPGVTGGVNKMHPYAWMTLLGVGGALICWFLLYESKEEKEIEDSGVKK